MTEIANSETKKVEQIRELLNMESAKFSVYRDRLIKKGLIKSTSHGYVDFTLPRFDRFVRGMYEL